MSDATPTEYIIEWRTGTRILSRPTGRWVQDPDGWWREIYTPGYTLLPDSTKIDEEEFIAPVRMGQPPQETLAEIMKPRRAWWERLWDLRG